MATSHSIELKRFSVVCDNCFVEITRSKYVKCHECVLDLCLPCFLAQTETAVHSKHHRYRVISRMDVEIYGGGWTLLEEMLFIHGLETCGIGNWADISNYVGENKDVESHFYELLRIERDPDATSEVGEKTSNPHRGLISSYMPYRREFDTEYMNDQETVIRDLSISEEDSETKKEFVEAIVSSYMNVVGCRNRRRHVILDKNLMDMKTLKRNEELAGGDFVKDIKCVAPYLTKSDFNVLFRGLYIENRLLALLKKHAGSYGRIDLGRLRSAEHLLSDQEKRLCDASKMAHGSYIELKRELALRLVRKKRMSRDAFKVLLDLPEDRMEPIYEFFRMQGLAGDAEDDAVL